MRRVVIRMLEEAGFKVIDSLGADARTILNREMINFFARRTEARPRAHSLWSPIDFPEHDTLTGRVKTTAATGDYVTDYTSWPGLVDKRFSGRHLPPIDPSYLRTLPPNPRYDDQGKIGQVTALFERPERMIPSRSSLLFMFFAQWFTDSLLRTDPIDRRKNTSNHDIDMCQIYGLDEATTRLLRAHEGGRMTTQIIDGEEYLDYLCEPDGDGDYRVRDRYRSLPAGQRDLDKILGEFKSEEPNRKAKLYATGLERGNQSIGYVALSTVFVREHNRIARTLQDQNPRWNDERLFQTARVICIVLELKLIIEEYINHILGMPVFRLDHSFAEDQHWYRANWMAIEFDLLYRWHGLAPDKIEVPGRTLQPKDFRNNNALLEELGVGAVIDAASRQRAGRISLFNTPSYLWDAEYASIKMGRDFRLRSFNDYRRRFNLKPFESFEALTSDAHVASVLSKMYGDDIEKLEFFVGLFAEEADEGLLFGELMNHMVAYDAFTQIFSNPLLSKNVYNAETFTEWGLAEIEATTSLQQVVDRNVRPRADGSGFKASLGISITGPELAIDEALGEVRAPGEDDVAQRIAEVIRTKLESVHDQKGGPVLRDQHAKSHGLVRARFEVVRDLPDRLARGVFVPGRSYDAWIRFSNGDEDAKRPDDKGDARGMAIKLFGVRGDRIPRDPIDEPEEEATAQDFVLMNHPTFLIDEPERYLTLLNRRNGSSSLGRLIAPLTLGPKGMLIAHAITSSKIASPLEARYWSATAYRLGDGDDRVAVKYSAIPVLRDDEPRSEIPDDPRPGFLRERMIEQLDPQGGRGWAFDFMVQTGLPDMSVEEVTDEWDEEDAPFERVATITIPAQDFATDEQDALAERTMFTPWRGLEAHRPLGAMNRVRRVVYEEIAKYRQRMNAPRS